MIFDTAAVVHMFGVGGCGPLDEDGGVLREHEERRHQDTNFSERDVKIELWDCWYMKSSLHLLALCRVMFSSESLSCSVLETSATESSAVAFFPWVDFIHVCHDSEKLPVRIMSKASELWHLIQHR